jgi:hypothetical protein
MCRNIKTLFNFDPPATDEEIKAASLQFVRKLSGFHDPSKSNETAFNEAIDEVAVVAQKLLHTLTTQAEPHNRDVEAAKAHTRALKRFGTAS